MATTLETRVQAQIMASRTIPKATGDIVEPYVLAFSKLYADGYAASQAEEIWVSQVEVVAAGAHDNWDLTSLPLKDEDGVTLRTITFTDIKGIMIVSSSGSGYLQLGGGTDGAGAADAFAGAGYPFTDDSDMGSCEAGGMWMTIGPSGGAAGVGCNIFHVGGMVAEQTYQMVVFGDLT